MSDIFGKISIESESPDPLRKKQKKTPSPTPKRRKKNNPGLWPKNLLWLILPLGILGLYSISGFWGVPYYLTTSIPKLATASYDVDVSPGKITFNPFSFTLRADSTKVDHHEGQSIASIPHLELNFAPIQLLRMDFVCTKVKLKSPSLNLVRNEDGSYNLSSLLPTLKENTNAAGMIGFSDLPFSFSLNNISIIDGTLTFADKPNNKTHNVHDIELQLPTLANIDFQADDYITPHFSAIVNGSPVTFKGQNKNDETSTTQSLDQLAWEMKDFPLQDYASYIPFDLPFTINNGIAEGMVGLKFEGLKNKDGRLSINFKLAIANIDFETHKKTLQLQSPAMHITGSFSPVKKLFLVENLRFEDPQVTAHTPHLLKELSDVFVIQKKQDQIGIVEEPVVFSLQSLEFTNGKLSHKKTKNKNEVPLEWTQLEANIGNYITQQSNTSVNKNPSTVGLTGQRKDTTNTFSFLGSFESPSVLSGKLSVDNITCQSLFTFLLPEQSSSTFRGSAKLDSVFSITERNATETFSYSLSQANVTVKNFKAIDSDKPVLEAEELSLSSALFTGDKINLGNVTVKNGNVSYALKSDSSIISQIIKGKYSILGLDYVGNINILPENTNALPFALKKASLKYVDNKDPQKKGGNLSISGLTDAQGKIDATGTVDLNPFKTALATTFTNVDNNTLSTILPDHNFIKNSKGTVSGKGSLTLPEITFSGNLKLTAGSYNKNKEQTFSWTGLNAEDINLSTKPYHLEVANIELDSPQFNISIEPNKGSMDQQLTDFLRSTLHNNSQKNSSSSPTDIEKITIKNGELTLRDNRLVPSWIVKSHALNGTIDNIHSASSTKNSPFSFTGTFDGSDFTWRGLIDPFKDSQTDKHQFTLTNYALKNFAKQLQPLSGINFNSATLSLTYSSDWITGALSHSIRSTFSQLKIDNPSSDSALALAILADVNGNVTMDSSVIQVSSPADSNLFDDLIGDWQKLVVKSSLSPFLLVNGDYNDLMDNNVIDFQPGLFMLSDAGRKSLLRYGSLLIAHPNIKLKLSGGVSIEEDKKSIHRQLEKNEANRVEKENEKLFAKWQSKKKEYESQFNNNQQRATSTGEIAESNIPNKVLAGFRPLLPEQVVVDNEMLFELAEKRLDIVKQHFMTQLSLAEGRIEVTQQLTKLISKNAHGKGVYIEILPFESSVLFKNE